VSIERIIDFEVGERLDKVVSAEFKQYSRSALEKLVKSGDITVNGSNVEPKYKMKAGDVVEADLAVFTQEIPEIYLPVIYEDDDVVVINKPAGVLTHAKGTLHTEATVATWLKQSYGTSEEFWVSNRAGIVHRLDRGTSGLIICAKNEKAQVYLQKQFSSRKVKKTYLALINNTLPETEGLIDIPIERNPKKPASFRAGNNGKTAQTSFKIIKSSNSETLVQLEPKTGRTHQLRVHLAYLNTPIVGDELYGGEPAQRMMLHAWKLELTLPNGERTQFEAPAPEGFDLT